MGDIDLQMLRMQGAPDPTGGTTRTFGNMLNQHNVSDKKKKKTSPWSKVQSKGAM